MMLELNEVLVEGEPQTLSLMAKAGEMTCLTGGSAERRTRWLLAMLGFQSVTHGYISIDGEPLTPASSAVFRSLIAYAPSRLCKLGEVVSYEPPSVQDVFSLKTNRELPISNGILGEEMRRVGADISDPRVQLLAVAVLLNKPILLVDNPPVLAGGYLKNLSATGKLVLITSVERELLALSDNILEI
jgi:ABC-type branched-subunit amino acid transport system ATPase component